MTYRGWVKENDHCYRRNERWTVVRTGKLWYAVRDGQACLVDFANEGDAMAEAERLKKEDARYE